MTNNVGQQQYPYGQLPGTFNGNPPLNPLKDTGIGQAASRTAEGAKDPNQVPKMVGSTAAGFIGCLGLEKIVDSFSKSSDDYKGSRFYKTSERIKSGKLGAWDNRLRNSDTTKSLVDKIINLGKNTKKFLKEKIFGEKAYDDAAAKFAEGATRESMLAPPTAKKMFIRGIAEEAEKILDGDLKKKLKEKLTDKEIEALKGQIKKIGEDGPNEILKDGSNKTLKDIYKDICDEVKSKIDIEKFNEFEESLTKSDRFKLLKGKTELLEYAARKETPLLSKLFIRGSMEVGEFMGGGVMGAIMNGVFLGMSIKSAMDAPKGEKTSTFMEDLLGNWIGGFMMMIPAAKLLHMVSGWKNIGVDNKVDNKVIKDEINRLRGELTRAATRKDAKEIIKKLRTLDKQAVEGMGVFPKVLRRIGRIVGWGQDPIIKVEDAFKGKSIQLGKELLAGKEITLGLKLKSLGYWIKGGLPGGILRLALIMLISAPAVALFKGISHKLFGKPTHAEEKAKEEKAKNGQANQPQNVANPVVLNKMMQNYLNGAKSGQAQLPEGNIAQQPAPVPEKPRYIPSTEPVKLQSDRIDAVTKALDKSKLVEEQANRILGNISKAS